MVIMSPRTSSPLSSTSLTTKPEEPETARETSTGSPALCRKQFTVASRLSATLDKKVAREKTKRTSVKRGSRERRASKAAKPSKSLKCRKSKKWRTSPPRPSPWKTTSERTTWPKTRQLKRTRL